jgi:hypothetical protein
MTLEAKMNVTHHKINAEIQILMAYSQELERRAERAREAILKEQSHGYFFKDPN